MPPFHYNHAKSNNTRTIKTYKHVNVYLQSVPCLGLLDYVCSSFIPVNLK